MSTILINEFSAGVLTQPASSDLPDGAAVVAENVKFDDAGKLKKQKQYKLDVAGPSGVTIISACKHRFNLPSPFGTKDIRLLYGTDGSGRDELWWYPYWNPVTEAWVDAWQELTEFEGPYTTDTGTSGTTIRDSELLSGTDDYYNGWVAMIIDPANVLAAATVLITDYVAATKDLTMKHSLAVASGQIYVIYRFPLRKYLEGLYTAGSGTTTTVVICTSLLSKVDDDYVGWTLTNTTRSDSATVTAYDASENRLTIDSAIASQTSGDSFIVYATTHNINAGDAVRFYPRENAVEMAVDNNTGFPYSAPLWFGFISKRYYFGNYSALGSTEFEGFWFDRNVMHRPKANTTTIVLAAGSGALASETYYVKTSFTYDGYQEGPLSEAITRASGGTSILIDSVLAPFYAALLSGSGEFDAILDKRTTHINIYVAIGSTGDAADDYFLFVKIPIVNLYVIGGGTYWSYDGAISSAAEFETAGNTWDLTDDILDGTDYIRTDGGATFGLSQKWTVAAGHKSKRVDANFKFKGSLEEQHYKGPVYLDQKRDTFVSLSVQVNGFGVPMDDVFPHELFINLSQKGATKVTGIVSTAGFIILGTPEKLFRYAPQQALVEDVSKIGNIADNGMKAFKGLCYFVGNEDVFVYDGVEPIPLMFGRILDQWQALTATQKQNAFLVPFEKTNSIWIFAGSTVFVFDIYYKSWRTYSSGLTPVWFADGLDGKLLMATSSNLYELESDTFTQAITFHWKSKVFDFVKEVGDKFLPIRAMIKRLIVQHKGDNRVVVKLYDPSISETYPKHETKFYPQSLGTPIDREVSFEAKQLQVDIVDEDTGAAQPEHEIDYIKIEYDEVV